MKVKTYVTWGALCSWHLVSLLQITTLVNISGFDCSSALIQTQSVFRCNFQIQKSLTVSIIRIQVTTYWPLPELHIPRMFSAITLNHYSHLTLQNLVVSKCTWCLIHLTHPYGCCTINSKPSKEKFQFIPHTFTVIFAFSYFSPTFRHSLRTKTRMSMSTKCLCVPHVYQPICKLVSATTLFVEVLRNSVKEFFMNTIQQVWVLQYAVQCPSHFP